MPPSTQRPIPLLRLLLAAASLIYLSTTVSQAQIVINTLTGDISTSDINNYISAINASSPPTNNLGDAMSFGDSGIACEGMGLMYDATGNITFLNDMIHWTDTILAYRNDQPRGPHQVMWDGQVDLIWPSYAVGTSQAGYAGCESADVAGHVARAALLILQHPSIWNTTIPDKNPYGFGVTYKQRALTYVKMMDATMVQYFNRWFFNSSNQFINPTDPRWAPLDENANAWNRQMMFLNGYTNLAECHDILGDHPAFLARYKAIIATCCDDFVASCYPKLAKGQPIYDWTYTGTSNGVYGGGEQISGVHAEYDLLGLFRAFGTHYSNVSAANMTQFANTLQNVVYLGPGDFTGNCDGSGSTQTWIHGGFVFMAQWNNPLYTEISQSDINANANGMWEAGCILWMKHWEYVNGHN